MRKSNCDRCTLCEARNKIVVSRGNPKATVLLIGEAPGEEEDKLGKCFVGAAGRMLDTHLQFCGIKSNEDIFLVNTVMCRPPENRKPKKKEIEACSEFLWKQIGFVRPRYIVLLGASAFEAVLQPRKQVIISHFAGRFLNPVSFNPEMAKKIGDARVYVCFHPSYALHNPTVIPTILDHWKKFFKEVARNE